MQGLCVRGDAASLEDAPTDEADSPVSTSCTTNADCTAANTVCQKSTGTCFSLTSPDCPDVLGDYKSDDAVIFGAILPTVIAHPPDFLTSLPDTGGAMKAALSMAVDDFASGKNPTKGLPPLPGKSAARPLVFVVCSDNESTTSTASATTHLVSDLGVPVIVGSAFSTFTRAIASTLASLQKTDVLMVTPRSIDLAAADNGGNYTRLSPIDDVQGAALSALVAQREAAIRAGVGDGGAVVIKVALVFKEDSYGNGVAAAVKAKLRFNGTDVAGNGTNFREFKYGNSDAPGYASQFATVTSGVFQYKPHAVIFVGTNEVVPGVLASLEANWNEPTYRPAYFMSDGVATRELWSYLAASDTSDSIRKRILGTMVTGTAPRFNAFAAAFASKFTQLAGIVYGAAGMYDAAYLLAYSAAGLGDKPITGPNLLDGFHLLAPGGGALQVGVGPDDITATFGKLLSGQAINLEGASSPLDFDASTHAASGVTTQVWCVPTAGGLAKPAILSGLSFDPTFNAQGAISSACGQ